MVTFYPSQFHREITSPLPVTQTNINDSKVLKSIEKITKVQAIQTPTNHKKTVIKTGEIRKPIK